MTTKPMSIFLSIIAFVFIFSILVLIHEAGHFYMAKRAGVKVEEFGFGLPPRLFGKKIGETIYSINAIPFGGFVRLYGEDSTSPTVLKNKKSFASKTVRQRILIVLGGVIMNFLLAFLLLTIGFTVGIKPLYVNEADVFTAISNNEIELQALAVDSETASIYLPNFVIEKSSGNKFGLNDGDVLWKIDSHNIWTINDVYENFINRMPFELTVQRVEDGELKELILPVDEGMEVNINEVLKDSVAEKNGFKDSFKILKLNDEAIKSVNHFIDLNYQNKGKLGKYLIEDENSERKIISFQIPDTGKIGLALSSYYPLSNLGFDVRQEFLPYEVVNVKNVQKPFYLAPFEAFKELKKLSKATFFGIGNVFKKIASEGEVPEGVSGPIGIAKLVHVSAEEGFSALIRLTAVLSLSLAVLNVLPIPALDGGRLLFIVIEVVTGSKPNQKLEAFAHQIGYILLLGLILFITYNDIVNLFFK